MERKTKNETTWWDILAIIVVCLLVGIVGARAQSYKQKDISQSDFVIYLDTMPSHIPIGSKIPDSTIVYRIGDYMPLRYKLNPVYELDEITAITQPVDHPFAPIKSLGYNRSTTIDFLMQLIVDLMEPGETITIKKVKE